MRRPLPSIDAFQQLVTALDRLQGASDARCWQSTPDGRSTPPLEALCRQPIRSPATDALLSADICITATGGVAASLGRRVEEADEQGTAGVPAGGRKRRLPAGRANAGRGGREERGVRGQNEQRQGNTKNLEGCYACGCFKRSVCGEVRSGIGRHDRAGTSAAALSCGTTTDKKTRDVRRQGNSTNSGEQCAAACRHALRRAERAAVSREKLLRGLRRSRPHRVLLPLHKLRRGGGEQLLLPVLVLLRRGRQEGGGRQRR